MGVFGFSGSKRRPKSIKAKINKELKKLEKKKLQKQLESLRKQNRGF